jgi:hypothetical protein
LLVGLWYTNTPRFFIFLWPRQTTCRSARSSAPGKKGSRGQGWTDKEGE